MWRRIQRSFLLVAAVLAAQSPTSNASRPAEEADVNTSHGSHAHSSYAHGLSEFGRDHGKRAEDSEENHGSLSHSGSGHSSGHGHDGGAHDEGDLDNAMGLVACACLLPSIVFFALTPGSLSVMTLKLIDVFVSIFLAVIWYSVFDQFIITFRLGRGKEGLLQSVDSNVFFFLVFTSLYLGACRICFTLRDATQSLIIFGGCAGHFIAFCAIGWALEGQSAVANSPLNPAPRMCSFVFCLGPVFMSYVIRIITKSAFLDRVSHPELTEVVDEMQIDIICLALTFTVTQAVGHSCLGFFPDTEQHNSVNQLGHAKNFLLLMSGWMCFLIVICYLMFPRLHELFSSHTKVHFIKSACFMLLAWGYLLVAQVLFHNHAQGGVIFMQESFSIITTFFALMALLLIHKVEASYPTGYRPVLETRNIAVTAIALTAAWSWEHCFKEALEIIAQEYQVGLQGLVPKAVIAIILPIFMLPPYVYYIKVAVIKNDHEAHHDHHGQEAHHEGHHSENEIDHANGSDLAASGPSDAEKSLGKTHSEDAVIDGGSGDAVKEE